MVLHEIVHQLVPTIIKASHPAVDDGDKQSLLALYSEQMVANKYNVACLGRGKQEIKRDCEDWLVVWDEDKCLPLQK